MEKPKLDWDARFALWTVVALFVVCIGAVVIQWLWTISPELLTEEMGNRIEAIRNILLIFSIPPALFALWLTWRRTRDMTRQVDSAETGKYHDRFQSALKMLEVEQENIQLAGIALLDRMRTEKPAMFDEIVTELFCDMVSDKLENRDKPVHLLHEAKMKSGFNPKVNARIANLLLEDKLRREPGRNFRREVSGTRIAEIEVSEPVGALDGLNWRLTFKVCHIERLTIQARENQKFKFLRCRIERLILDFDDEKCDKPIELRGCVIDQIEVFGPPGEAFSEVNFARQIKLAGCTLSNGDPLTKTQIVGAADIELGESKIVSESRDWKFKPPGEG